MTPVISTLMIARGHHIIQYVTSPVIKIEDKLQNSV